ncbi:MAG: dTDP-4-dehydrorhamnose reductase [Bacteroidales bacterium]|nr:dTDP-4-dehydrorhamnose reductase [Bacteroidales bacterium]
MKKILVTGAKGQLGKEISLLKKMMPGTRFYFMDIDEMDIRDAKEVNRTIKGIKPDYLVNCAAYTAVDRAEKEGKEAFAVNAAAVKNMVDAATTVPGLKLIHISTDFVFDGKRKSPYPEDARTAALSVYGKSKEAGERYALSYPHAMIIRTSWMYSGHGGNFVKTVLKLSGERDAINVVYDQTGTPTWAADLAAAVLNIIKLAIKDDKNFLPGIYHYSNEGQCTWYEFACEIKKIMGLDIKIMPVSTAEYPLPALRPSYSVLRLDKIKNTYNIEIPSWQYSLEKFLKSKKL